MSAGLLRVLSPLAGMLLTLAVMLAGTAAPAAADPSPPQPGEYRVRTCYADAGSPADSGQSWSPMWAYLMLPDRCPDPGIGFDAAGGSDVLSPGYSEEITYVNSRDVRITGIRMRVSGGDTSQGIEYVLAPCYGCAPFAGFGERTAASPDGELVTFAVPHSETIALRAVCTRTVEDCDTDRAFMVRDIQLTKVDDVPPSGYIFVESEEYVYGPDMAFHWFRPGQMQLRLGASDEGAGISAAAAAVDGNEIWSHTGDCRAPIEMTIYDDENGWQPEGEDWFDADEICTAMYAGRDAILDFDGLADGTHELALAATDGVGNAIDPPLTRLFGVDANPPERPQNVRRAGGPASGPDWTADTALQLDWDDPATGWDDNGSPFIRTLLREDPPSAAPAAPQEVFRDQSGPLAMTDDGTWKYRVWFEDGAGNQGAYEERSVGLDRDAPLPPQVEPLGWIGLDDLLSGVFLNWTTPDQAELESGVCKHLLSLTDDATDQPSDSAKQVTGTSALLTPLHEGTQFAHMVAVSCSELKSPPVHSPVRVDLTAPEVSPDPSPPAGWSRSAVDVGIRAVDQGSGVASITRRLDDQAPQSSGGDSHHVTVGEGIHTLRYSAADDAGNDSGERTLKLNVDQTAPTALFDPRDPADPARVSATVEDLTSGVDSAWIELRQSDDGAAHPWTLLGDVERPAAESAKQVSLSARVADGLLAPGAYELRVVAIDNAGNAGGGNGVRPLGAPMRITLPLREQVELTATIATLRRACKSGSGSRCTGRWLPSTRGAATRRVLEYAQRPAVAGRITDARGEPVAGAELQISEVVEGAGAPRPAGNAVTDADGRYWRRLARGPSRKVRVTFGGSQAVAPRSQAASLYVRAGVVVASSRRSVRSFGRVVFSGRLLGDRSELPVGGKLVVVQFWNGKSWKPAVDMPYTDARGRFTSVPWEVGRVEGPKTVHFRVIAPGEGWPYRTGISRQMDIRVRP